MQAFIETAARNPEWVWYAIADSAQHRDLPGALVKKSGLQTRCLFDAPPGSPLAAQSPHLVQLNMPAAQDPEWKWIARNAGTKPCVSVMACEAGFDTLFTHLQGFTEVLLPDGDDMFFAFWDPAILGTLVGQSDDPTLYVPGPVLTGVQRATLTHHLAGWWYWDRNGEIRSLEMPGEKTEQAKTPLQLTQQQVDDLVEASVPDHVLTLLRENHPQLLVDIATQKQHGNVCCLLKEARKLHLEGMKDLVNFICLGLIYRQRIQEDPVIVALLENVKNKVLSIEEAMAQMPQ